MKNKVALSFFVPQEVRRFLRKMAVNEDKTMATLLEEMIIIRWQQANIDKKDGTI